METVDNCSSGRMVAGELRDTVPILPTRVRDFGALKIVLLQSAALVLLDEHAPVNAAGMTSREISSTLLRSQSVYLLRVGFNVDRIMAALRSGRYERCSPRDATISIKNVLRDGAKEQSRPHSFPAEKQIQENSQFVFQSSEMQKLDYEVSRIARFEFDVLLSGETGVGKDLVASEIHRRSPRHRSQFVSVPLRSLSPTLIESELFGHERGAFSGAERAKAGKFEAAEKGTVYIPEISCLNEEMQLKLLYFMQYKRCHRVGEDPRKPERRCDVRMIFATNDDLGKLVASGRLREDFYYRIKGLSLHIPPLRERRADILPLVRHFIQRYGHGRQYKLPEDTRRLLTSYSWPGNVRELENSIKAVIPFATGENITPEMIPIGGNDCNSTQQHCFHSQIEKMAELPPLARLEQEFRKSYFGNVLKRCGNHIPTAASMAGMTEQGFRKAIQKLDRGGRSPQQ